MAALLGLESAWVDRLLENEQLLQGIHIIRMDVFSLMNAVETDPTHFGFTEVTDFPLDHSSVP